MELNTAKMTHSETKQFIWKIHDSDRVHSDRTKLYSDAFSVGDFSWCLLVCLKEYSTCHLPLYLCMIEHLPDGFLVEADASISIFDLIEKRCTVTKETPIIFHSRRKSWSISHQISFYKTYSEGPRLLEENLVIKANVTVRQVCFLPNHYPRKMSYFNAESHENPSQRCPWMDMVLEEFEDDSSSLYIAKELIRCIGNDSDTVEVHDTEDGKFDETSDFLEESPDALDEDVMETNGPEVEPEKDGPASEVGVPSSGDKKGQILLNRNENSDIAHAVAPEQVVDDEKSHLAEPSKESNEGKDDQGGTEFVSMALPASVSYNEPEEGELVKGFFVPVSWVKVVKHIFKKYPDLTLNVHPKNECIKEVYMDIFIGIIRTLSRSPGELSEDEISKVRSDLTDLEVSGFETDWLKPKVEEVSRRRERVVKSRVDQLGEQLEKMKMIVSEFEAQLEKERTEIAALAAPLSLEDLLVD